MPSALDRVRFIRDKADYLAAGGVIDEERPCLADWAHRYSDWQYHAMNLWAFRRIYRQRPRKHVDVASQPGFLTILSEFVAVDFVDLRDPGVNRFGNLEWVPGDITALPYPDGSVESLSCLHVAEHIGLGRYGDKVDPQGFDKACAELRRILAPGGSLYFAVPAGKSKTVFNAHRVISPAQIVDNFGDLDRIDFSAILTDGRFVEGVDPSVVESEEYACGCWHLRRDS